MEFEIIRFDEKEYYERVKDYLDNNEIFKNNNVLADYGINTKAYYCFGSMVVYLTKENESAVLLDRFGPLDKMVGEVSILQNNPFRERLKSEIGVLIQE